MNLNKLAVFLSEFGYDESESLFNLDADLLQKAVAGESLSEYETALLDNAYSNLILAETDFIDFQSINETASNLETALSLINDAELADSFRESFSFGQVDAEIFNDTWQLFGNLSYSQTAMLVDWLSDNPDLNASEFLTAYLVDGGDIWEDVSDSEFWEWFRTVFYE